MTDWAEKTYCWKKRVVARCYRALPGLIFDLGQGRILLLLPFEEFAHEGELFTSSVFVAGFSSMGTEP